MFVGGVWKLCQVAEPEGTEGGCKIIVNCFTSSADTWLRETKLQFMALNTCDSFHDRTLRLMAKDGN